MIVKDKENLYSHNDDQNISSGICLIRTYVCNYNDPACHVSDDQ